jgi:hypothetical protein
MARISVGYFGKPNLHNDSLKILVEYGGLAWVVFFGLLYRRQSLACRLLMLFFNIVLLTDNALIYPYFIFALGLAVQRFSEADVSLQVGGAIDIKKKRVTRRVSPVGLPSL